MPLEPQTLTPLPAMDDQIAKPALKLASVGTAWFAGVSWGDLASMLASFYTMLLILDWGWRRVVRPSWNRRRAQRGEILAAETAPGALAEKDSG